jgi:hypothetical protein
MKAVRAYGDGVAVFSVEPVVKNSFGANAKGPREEAIRLPFAWQKLRAEDEEYADKIGRRVTAKIVCPLPGVSLRGANDWLCAVGDELYSVVWVNPDKWLKELYIYMEGQGDA